MRKMLSINDAYKAMFIFLDSIYDRNKSNELGMLLGDMSLLDDNKPADSAIWEDWLKAIEKVKSEEFDIKLNLHKE